MFCLVSFFCFIVTTTLIWATYCLLFLESAFIKTNVTKYGQYKPEWSLHCFGLLAIYWKCFQLPPPLTLVLPSPPPHTPLPLVLVPSVAPPPTHSLTRAWLRRNRGRCSRSTQLPPPQHLPFVLDQQLTPGKNWPYKHTHTHVQRTPLHKSVLAQQLSDWMNNTHTYTHIYTHTASAVQSPSVSLIVATQGSGLVSASRAEGLSGQLAWLILLLEATGSQTNSQGPPGSHRARISGRRESVICLKCKGVFFLFALSSINAIQ